MDYPRELAVAKDIALRAGGVMLEHYEAERGLEMKADGSPVTIADRQINHIVIDELAKHFADDGVIGEEESTAEYGSGRRWICDPIDGTRAFIAGLPLSKFALGFVVDGVPVVGVVYDPFMKELYEGAVGQGSFRNGKRLRVSQQKMPNGHVAITSKLERLLRSPEYVQKIIARSGYPITFTCGCKPILVASGRFVGTLETDCNAIYIAGSHVIVEEAGGKVTDFAEAALDYTRPFKGVITSNQVVHDELLQICRESELTTTFD